MPRAKSLAAGEVSSNPLGAPADDYTGGIRITRCLNSLFGDCHEGHGHVDPYSGVFGWCFGFPEVDRR